VVFLNVPREERRRCIAGIETSLGSLRGEGGGGGEGGANEGKRPLDVRCNIGVLVLENNRTSNIEIHNLSDRCGWTLYDRSIDHDFMWSPNFQGRGYVEGSAAQLQSIPTASSHPAKRPR